MGAGDCRVLFICCYLTSRNPTDGWMRKEPKSVAGFSIYLYLLIKPNQPIDGYDLTRFVMRRHYNAHINLVMAIMIWQWIDQVL